MAAIDAKDIFLNTRDQIPRVTPTRGTSPRQASMRMTGRSVMRCSSAARHGAEVDHADVLLGDASGIDADLARAIA
jgi:hypothetical protein